MHEFTYALALLLLASSAAYAKTGVRSANTDTDRDGLPDYLDNCQLIANVNQRDTDGDGIGNFCDPDLNSCMLIANLNQRDTNTDGFGNICDPDLDGSLFVDVVDLGIFNVAFGSIPGDPNWNPDADFDGDDDVDADDLLILNAFFSGPPGP